MAAIAASAGTKTVYLAPGPWDVNDVTERYALYMFDNDAGTNACASFTEGDNGIWSAEFNDTYPNMIICRMNGANDENSGGNKWTQTADLDAPFADGLTYTMSARDDDTPANNTYYISAYLYNPTTGLFLSRGAGYGTACWADNFGIPVIFVANDGGYRLQYMDQTDQYVSDSNWSWADGGTDRAQTYTVSSVDGGYKFTNKANSLTLYINAGAAQSGFSHQIASNGSSDNCTENWDVWQLKSSAQREAILAARTSEAEAAIADEMGYTLTGTLKELVEDANTFAATDKTSSITNAALVGDYRAGWTYTKVSGGNATTDNNDGVEIYQGCGTFSQTVSNLTNGIYKVTLGGFYRDGWNERCSELSNNGWKLGNAYLEANGNQVRLADWASDRSADNAPNGTGSAKTLINEGKYLNEVYANVTEGTLTINIAQPGAAVAGRWFFISNATLTYYSDQVSDEDAAAIIAQAETLEATPMLAATKTALTSAKTTFSGSKTIANYNALGTAIANAQTAADVYAPLGTALADANTTKATYVANDATYTTTFETNIAAINTAYTEGSIAEADITAKINEVKAEVVLLVKSQTADGSNMTLAVPNATCNTAAGEDNWKIENALASGEYFRLDTWAGTASGMSVPMIEYWITNGNTLSSNVIYQTITGLHPGVYTVTAETAVNNESKVAPNAGSALLFANEATTDITSGATTTSFSGQTGTFSVQTVLTEADGGSLKIGFKTVSPNYNWIAFKNVTLTFDGVTASDEQKQALADAITAAEAKTLGFEKDEYAPYNNIAALEALAAAKAVVPATAVATEVVNATTALTNATWTANTEEVNAVYDGSFASTYSHDGNVMPIGWHGVGNHDNSTDVRLMWNVESNAGLNAASNKQAAFAKFTAIYGNEIGYTMPLKAGTYKLDFIYGGWNEQGTREIKVYSGDTQATILPASITAKDNTAHTTVDSWSTYNGVVTIPTDGDYVLSFYRENTNSQNQIVISDIVLKKTTPIYAVVGSKKDEDSEKAIFSSGWDQATTTDILTEESEGVYTKTYSAQELDAQTIAYKVILKNDVNATVAAAWYPADNQEVVVGPVKGGYDITFTFTEGETPTVAGTATKVSEAVTIGSAGWATTVTNSALDFSGETEFTAYTATVSDNTVTLTQVDDVQAETGLVLKGTAGTYYVPVAVSSDTEKGSLMFSSTLTYNTWQPNDGSTNNFYGLKYDAVKEEAKFAKIDVADGTALPAGKAFLLINTPAAGARELSVVFADEIITGIANMKAAKEDGLYYNLNGQRVNAPAKGLYIVNGKKVIKK